MQKSKEVENHFKLLGLKVKDKVTGFEGVVSSLSFDLYGCVQVVIQPPMGSEGSYPEGRWFDVNRLKILSKKPVMTLPNFEFGAQAEGGQGAADKPLP